MSGWSPDSRRSGDHPSLAAARPTTRTVRFTAPRNFRAIRTRVKQLPCKALGPRRSRLRAPTVTRPWLSQPDRSQVLHCVPSPIWCTGSGALVDIERLLFGEEVPGLAATQAPESGERDPAEGHVGLVPDRGSVDVDGADAQLAGKTNGTVGVVGQDRGDEAIGVLFAWSVISVSEAQDCTVTRGENASSWCNRAAGLTVPSTVGRASSPSASPPARRWAPWVRASTTSSRKRSAAR